jgi:hypothetical protein
MALDIPHLDDMPVISQGVAVVQQEGLWKILAIATGKMRETQYQSWTKSGYYMYPFHENISAVIYYENDLPGFRCGYIDMNLKEIKPLEFEWTKSFSQGLAAVQVKGKWGYVNKSGERVIPNIYEEALDFHVVPWKK